MISKIRKGAMMGKIKDAINNVEDIYMYVNSFNEIQKKKQRSIADIDCDRYHEEQDHIAMEKAKK